METAYGAGTDPTPYIMAAYGLGLFGMAGFAAWNVTLRQRLRALLVAVKAPTPPRR